MFVGGLFPETTSETLRDYFSQFGVVLDVKIIGEKQNRSRGFGFILFNSMKTYKTVTSRKHVIDGREVDCGSAVYSKENNRDEAVVKNEKKIFIRSLPTDTTKSELNTFFAKFGEIDKILLVKRKNKSHAFAFITFVEQRVAEEVVSIRNHRMENGVVFDCEKAQPKVRSYLNKPGGDNGSRRDGSSVQPGGEDSGMKKKKKKKKKRNNQKQHDRGREGGLGGGSHAGGHKRNSSYQLSNDVPSFYEDSGHQGGHRRNRSGVTSNAGGGARYKEQGIRAPPGHWQGQETYQNDYSEYKRKSRQEGQNSSKKPPLPRSQGRLASNSPQPQEGDAQRTKNPQNQFSGPGSHQIQQQPYGGTQQGYNYQTGTTPTNISTNKNNNLFPSPGKFTYGQSSMPSPFNLPQGQQVYFNNKNRPNNPFGSRGGVPPLGASNMNPSLGRGLGGQGGVQQGNHGVLKNFNYYSNNFYYSLNDPAAFYGRAQPSPQQQQQKMITERDRMPGEAASPENVAGRQQMMDMRKMGYLSTNQHLGPNRGFVEDMDAPRAQTSSYYEFGNPQNNKNSKQWLNMGQVGSPPNNAYRAGGGSHLQQGFRLDGSAPQNGEYQDQRESKNQHEGLTPNNNSNRKPNAVGAPEYGEGDEEESLPEENEGNRNLDQSANQNRRNRTNTQNRGNNAHQGHENRNRLQADEQGQGRGEHQQDGEELPRNVSLSPPCPNSYLQSRQHEFGINIIQSRDSSNSQNDPDYYSANLDPAAQDHPQDQERINPHPELSFKSNNSSKCSITKIISSDARKRDEERKGSGTTENFRFNRSNPSSRNSHSQRSQQSNISITKGESTMNQVGFEDDVGGVESPQNTNNVNLNIASYKRNLENLNEERYTYKGLLLPGKPTPSPRMLSPRASLPVCVEPKKSPYRHRLSAAYNLAEGEQLPIPGLGDYLRAYPDANHSDQASPVISDTSYEDLDDANDNMRKRSLSGSGLPSTGKKSRRGSRRCGNQGKVLLGGSMEKNGRTGEGEGKSPVTNKPLVSITLEYEKSRDYGKLRRKESKERKEEEVDPADELYDEDDVNDGEEKSLDSQEE